MAGGERDDQVAMQLEQPGRRNDDAAVGHTRELCNRALHMTAVADNDRDQLDAHYLCYSPECPDLPDCRSTFGVVAKNGYSLHRGRNLLEQFSPLSGQSIFEGGKSGGVAAGLRQ